MRAYYYFFYKIYRFWENAPIKFWSHFKTGLTIIFLEIWLVLSFFIYYNFFIDRYFHLNENLFLSLSLILIVFNFLFFGLSNKWKLYNKEFNQLPKKKNLVGGIIVWSIVILIIINLIYSFYLMSQVDWSQYS